MAVAVGIDGVDFLIDGRPTYEGVWHEGRRIEGLLLNSRMVQAIFDDENPETRGAWAYPDTGCWDPERNTDEFCAALPLYRRAGLLGVTVGLQGGGSVYSEPLYGSYQNSAFAPDGSLKDAYLARLRRVLAAADDCGMVVIVNYFYWRQERFESDAAILHAAEGATDWLLSTGHRNLLVDLKNEIQEGDGLLRAGGIHRVLDAVRQTTRDGRRLPVGTSTFPHNHIPAGDWPAYCDFFMPHGNDSYPEPFRAELRAIKQWEPFVRHPRPLLVNEDSVDIRNLEVCLDEHVSWGYFDQGYGSEGIHGKHDWTVRPRESRYVELSGFQTVPVHWGINTPHKRAFFDRVREVTGGG